MNIECVLSQDKTVDVYSNIDRAVLVYPSSSSSKITQTSSKAVLLLRSFIFVDNLTYPA